MPSLRSNKNLRALLPYPVTEERVCIGVSVPNDPQWIAAFYGQLQRLSLQSIWDRDPAHTAKDIAAVWWRVYLDTLAGNCMGECDDCLGKLVRDPATGWYGYRPDGSIDFVRIPDGDWSETYPPSEWPAPQPYTEGTDENRRCIAARNATIALRMLYQQTWGEFIDVTIETVLRLSASVLAAFSTLLVVPFGLNQLLEIAKEMLDNSEAFTDPFPDEDVQPVQCILYCNSSIDEDGVVTFDFDEVVAAFGAEGTSPYLGLNFLLQLYLGEGGLNAAGGIHNEDAADCGGCDCPFPWCHYADLGDTDDGFVMVPGERGVWTSEVGWQGQFYNTESRCELAIDRTFTDAFISRLWLEYDKSGGSGANNVTRVQLFKDGALAWQNTDNPTGLNLEREFFPEVEADRFLFVVNTGTFAGAVTLEQWQIEGIEGENPFGESNC